MIVGAAPPPLPPAGASGHVRPNLAQNLPPPLPPGQQQQPHAEMLSGLVKQNSAPMFHPSGSLVQFGSGGSGSIPTFSRRDGAATAAPAKQQVYLHQAPPLPTQQQQFSSVQSGFRRSGSQLLPPIHLHQGPPSQVSPASTDGHGGTGAMPSAAPAALPPHHQQVYQQQQQQRHLRQARQQQPPRAEHQQAQQQPKSKVITTGAAPESGRPPTEASGPPANAASLQHQHRHTSSSSHLQSAVGSRLTSTARMGGMTTMVTAYPLARPGDAEDGFAEIRTIVEDYENFVRIKDRERQQQLAAKDTEIHTLRATVQQLEWALQGASDEIDINSLIRTKETELKILFEQRDLEIRSLESELQAKDKICGDLQRIIQTTRGPSAQAEVRSMRRLLDVRESELRKTQELLALKEKDLKSAIVELTAKDALLEKYKKYHPEIQSVQTRGAADQLDEMDVEVKAMRNELESLRMERQEMQEILAHKDKQLTALAAIDPSTTEASAVMLGVQAISMVHSGLELKERIRTLEAEAAASKESYNQALEDNERNANRLAEKRREAAGLVETLATRDMRIARLETLLQHRDKEFKSTNDENRKFLGAEKEKSARLTQELRISAEQAFKMRQELSERHDRILQLQADGVRATALIREKEEKLAIANDELAECQSQLNKVVKATTAKDKYVVELEKHMKENDLRRQASYLQEVARNRKLQLDMRMKEAENSNAVTDKEEKIRHLRGELTASATQLASVKNLLLDTVTAPGSISPTIGVGGGGSVPLPAFADHSAAPQQHQHALHAEGIQQQQRRLLDAITSPSSIDGDGKSGVTSVMGGGGYYSVSPAPRGATIAHQSRRARHRRHSGGRSRQLHAFSPESEPGLQGLRDPLGTLHGRSGRRSAGGRRTGSPSYAGRLPQDARPIKDIASLGRQIDSTLTSLLGTYKPVRGDPVDQALAGQLRIPQFKTLVSLMCRLSAGVYLCGAERIHLRLSREGTLEGRTASVVGSSSGGGAVGTSWLTFGRLLAQLEANRALADIGARTADSSVVDASLRGDGTTVADDSSATGMVSAALRAAMYVESSSQEDGLALPQMDFAEGVPLSAPPMVDGGGHDSYAGQLQAEDHGLL